MKVTSHKQFHVYDDDIISTIRLRPSDGMFFRTGGKTFDEAAQTLAKIKHFVAKHEVMTTKDAQKLEILLAVPQIGLRSDYGWDVEDLKEFTIHNCGNSAYGIEYWALAGPKPHML